MPTIDTRLDRIVIRKITVRIMLFLTLMYLLNQIDRGNLAFAQERMSTDLGLSNAAFGLGAGIFFIGYFIFEVPSNILLHRIGARRWLARIMVSWGLVAAAMMFTFNESSFYILRFLLGAAEAGFFPGAVYYIALWLPGRRRSQAMALLSAAGPAAYLLAGPLAGLILGLEGFAGLHGWQWLFAIEGGATVLVGILCWFVLTDRPEQAKWLSPSEKSHLLASLAESSTSHDSGKRSLSTVIREPRVVMLAGIYACIQITNAGLIFWLPSITAQIPGLSQFQLMSLSVLPYAFQVIGLFVLGRSSDRHGRRHLHVLLGVLCIVVGLCVSALTGPVAGLIALCLAFFGYGTMSAFWSLASDYLGTTAAGAGGLAFVNSVAALGGFVGPTLFGYLLDITGDTVLALCSLATFGAIAAVLTLFVKDNLSSGRGGHTADSINTSIPAPSKGASS
ncbi:MFS transporter [Brevibacterium zhoupengii]|uniref:MFS transporter n=1 Tax=Brevibacterium zhoupengii TaxID=2898795 RepID=UPI001E4AA9D0|nr:MFS transporter [Brevibacterium zhoupengii]